jgi:hypothetical protein
MIDKGKEKEISARKVDWRIDSRRLCRDAVMHWPDFECVNSIGLTKADVLLREVDGHLKTVSGAGKRGLEWDETMYFNYFEIKKNDLSIENFDCIANKTVSSTRSCRSWKRIIYRRK